MCARVGGCAAASGRWRGLGCGLLGAVVLLQEVPVQALERAEGGGIPGGGVLQSALLHSCTVLFAGTWECDDSVRSPFSIFYQLAYHFCPARDVQLLHCSKCNTAVQTRFTSAKLSSRIFGEDGRQLS